MLDGETSTLKDVSMAIPFSASIIGEFTKVVEFHSSPTPDTPRTVELFIESCKLKLDCMSNCPDKFRGNCAFNEVKCHICSADNYAGVGKLYYWPILDDEELISKKHPVHIAKLKAERINEAEQKAIRKERGKASSLGRKVERKIVAKLKSKSSLIAETLASGALFHNGDAVLKLNQNISIEHKLRVSNRNITGPTSKEWEKSKCIFIISSSSLGSVVTLREDLLHLILEELNICYSSSTVNNNIDIHTIKRLNKKNSSGPTIQEWKGKEDYIFILDTPNRGRVASMMIKTFKLIISNE